jgi:hypothetical protein
MKKNYFVLAVALFVLFAGVLVGCARTPTIDNNEISVPNVMGVDHSDAKTVLEDADFTVSEIEADASTILPTSGWDRTVKKGQVFKVNDTLSPHYSSMEVTDNKITIYYAAEDYIYEEPTEEPMEEESSQEQDSIAEEPATSDLTVEEPDTSDSTVEEPVISDSTVDDVDWRQFLKEYEEWADDYVEILKKYGENPSDPTFLSDYLESMEKLAEWSEKADKIETDLADDPKALNEYLEMLMRVMTKLSKV